MNTYWGVIGGAVVSALLAILAWILKRTDRAMGQSGQAITLSNQNMKSTGEQMMLIEALRQAIYLQGDRLDDWEDWGVEIRRLWRRMQQHLIDHAVLNKIEELPVPPKHLDLSFLYKDLPKHGPNSGEGRDDGRRADDE